MENENRIIKWMFYSYWPCRVGWPELVVQNWLSKFNRLFIDYQIVSIEPVGGIKLIKDLCKKVVHIVDI